MAYELKNERETLARVARILRGEEPAPIVRDKPVIYRQSAQCSARSDPETGEFCGTAACIGGHAWLLENPGDTYGAVNHVDEVADDGAPLERLYWGALRATPLQGAAAIDNYLAGGDPRWHEVRSTVDLDNQAPELGA